MERIEEYWRSNVMKEAVIFISAYLIILNLVLSYEIKDIKKNIECLRCKLED